ncbi:MAG: UxaA family hydrolase [Rhodobacteraceae bacterium]|nr:UxaA family hydrolase [Paracoccaceae bacterium]
MAMTETESRLIRLAAPDNVLLLATTIAGGETILVNGREVTLETGLGLGHKIAAQDIAAGETILKYNFPIGIAAVDIPAGAHVHVHNVKSNYTASYVVPEEA